uniref:Uncharacterized protein n=1 Tax=Globodera rostochiensis TaxID=31243 RepID=A0A914H821_GLORO
MSKPSTLQAVQNPVLCVCAIVVLAFRQSIVPFYNPLNNTNQPTKPNIFEPTRAGVLQLLLLLLLTAAL